MEKQLNNHLETLLQQMLLEEHTKYVPSSVEDALYMESSVITISIDSEYEFSVDMHAEVYPHVERGSWENFGVSRF